MKTYIIITLAIALSSCNILRKNKQTLQKQSFKEQFELVEQRNSKSQKREMMLIDSNHSDFTMLLWPKGKFTFSIAKGFEGEAEKLMVVAKKNQVKTINLKNEMKQDSVLSKLTHSYEKENSTLVQKKKLSVGYKWGWLILISVVYLCYWFYKRFGYYI